MYKIGICGHFGGEKVCLDGQTVKTKIIAEELEKKYKIKKIDTFNGKKRILIILFKLFFLIINCKNIIILPAHNSLRIFVPFLVVWNIFFKRKLHYIVIGGWLSKYISEKKYLKIFLKKFDYIYVETSTMKNSLEKQGFQNIIIMPNYKNLKILKVEELVYNLKKPYKLCIFSRVMKEKGIEDAIEIVKYINEKFHDEIYTLDIYGQVDEKYKEEFEKIIKNFPKYIKYKGCVEFNKSVEILKNYYVLLFPTHYYTEGIPGTIIDAYSAGIPVIAAKWESFHDIIDENITGKGYEFGKILELRKVLNDIIFKVEEVNNMKKNCLKKARYYNISEGIEKYKKFF